MSKFSIRSKIIAVIAFMLLAMAGLGLLAVQSMQAINAHTVDIANNWLPSVRVLGELRADINLLRIALRAHVMAETPDDKTAGEKRLSGILDAIAKDRKKYEPLVTTPAEHAIYDDWSRAWDKYLKGVQDVVELSRQSVGRIPHEATELLAKSVAVMAAQSDEFLKKDIDLNNDGADAATRAAADGYNTAFWIVLSIIIATVVVGVSIGAYLVREVSSGIASIVRPMQALGSGDLSAEVPHRGEQTEIGAMADTLQVFKEALIAKKAADEAAARDAEAKIERGRRVDRVTRDFESMIGEIVETVSSASTQLEGSAGRLSSTASRAQELSTVVAAASEEASTNVSSVASATEELSSSITEISRQVQESARIASEAVDQARRTNDRVGELSKAASRIGEVIGLIQSIAGQTNLLALNATIEAARAGDAGRGFAVVASEVKSLAVQTAKATEEITREILSVQSSTTSAVAAIRDITQRMRDINQYTSAVAGSVEQQEAATGEISHNVASAAASAKSIAAALDEVAGGVTQTRSSAETMLAATEEVETATAKLRSEFEEFLGTVAA